MCTDAPSVTPGFLSSKNHMKTLFLIVSEHHRRSNVLQYRGSDYNTITNVSTKAPTQGNDTDATNTVRRF